MVGWLDEYQRRRRTVGLVIAVVYKYIDDQGAYLAALITYYAVVALFPILLLFTTVVGVVLARDPELQGRIVDSTLSQLPVIGGQFGQPRRLSGGIGGVIVGIAGAIYGALGVGQATQNAMDTIWAVPRNSRRDPIWSRIRSLLLIVVVATLLMATTALTAVNRQAHAFGIDDSFTKVGVVLFGVLVNTAVWTVVFRAATAREVTLRYVLPGAFAAAVALQLVQWFSALYVARVVTSASVTNSIFAVVLGLMAFLYLVAVTLILCAEFNAVRVDGLHPRALLTPFTDDVALTPGDRKAYADKAKSARLKGFQEVDVTFDTRSKR